MTIVLTSVFMLAAGAVELALGRHGWLVPGLALVAFHCLAVHGWRSVLPTAVLVALLVDVAFGRALLPSVLFLLPLAFFAHLWRVYGDHRSRILLALPGGLLAGGWVLALLAARLPSGGPVEVGRLAGALSMAAPAGAVLLPVVGLALDTVAGRVGLSGLAAVKPRSWKTHGFGHPGRSATT